MTPKLEPWLASQVIDALTAPLQSSQAGPPSQDRIVLDLSSQNFVQCIESLSNDEDTSYGPKSFWVSDSQVRIRARLSNYARKQFERKTASSFATASLGSYVLVKEFQVIFEPTSSHVSLCIMRIGKVTGAGSPDVGEPDNIEQDDRLRALLGGPSNLHEGNDEAGKSDLQSQPGTSSPRNMDITEDFATQAPIPRGTSSPGSLPSSASDLLYTIDQAPTTKALRPVMETSLSAQNQALLALISKSAVTAKHQPNRLPGRRVASITSQDSEKENSQEYQSSTQQSKHNPVEADIEEHKAHSPVLQKAQTRQEEARHAQTKSDVLPSRLSQTTPSGKYLDQQPLYNHQKTSTGATKPTAGEDRDYLDYLEGFAMQRPKPVRIPKDQQRILKEESSWNIVGLNLPESVVNDLVSFATQRREVAENQADDLRSISRQSLQTVHVAASPTPTKSLSADEQSAAESESDSADIRSVSWDQTPPRQHVTSTAQAVESPIIATQQSDFSDSQALPDSTNLPTSELQSIISSGAFTSYQRQTQATNNEDSEEEQDEEMELEYVPPQPITSEVFESSELHNEDVDMVDVDDDKSIILPYSQSDLGKPRRLVNTQSPSRPKSNRLDKAASSNQMGDRHSQSANALESRSHDDRLSRQANKDVKSSKRKAESEEGSLPPFKTVKSTHNLAPSQISSQDANNDETLSQTRLEHKSQKRSVSITELSAPPSVSRSNPRRVDLKSSADTDDIYEVSQADHDSEAHDEDRFDAFKSAYPSYDCDLGSFIKSCVYIEWLHKTQRAPHPFLWDDFIRTYSTEYIEYYAKETTDEKVMTGLEYFNLKVVKPQYSKCIITPETLEDAISIDQEVASKFRASFGGPNMPKISSQVELNALHIDSIQSTPTTAISPWQDTSGKSNHNEGPRIKYVKPSNSRTHSGNRDVVIEVSERPGLLEITPRIDCRSSVELDSGISSCGTSAPESRSLENSSLATILTSARLKKTQDVSPPPSSRKASSKRSVNQISEQSKSESKNHPIQQEGSPILGSSIASPLAQKDLPSRQPFSSIAAPSGVSLSPRSRPRPSFAVDASSITITSGPASSASPASRPTLLNLKSGVLRKLPQGWEPSRSLDAKESISTPSSTLLSQEPSTLRTSRILNPLNPKTWVPARLKQNLASRSEPATPSSNDTHNSNHTPVTSSSARMDSKPRYPTVTLLGLPKPPLRSLSSASAKTASSPVRRPTVTLDPSKRRSFASILGTKPLSSTQQQQSPVTSRKLFGGVGSSSTLMSSTQPAGSRPMSSTFPRAFQPKLLSKSGAKNEPETQEFSF